MVGHLIVHAVGGIGDGVRGKDVKEFIMGDGLSSEVVEDGDDGEGDHTLHAGEGACVDTFGSQPTEDDGAAAVLMNGHDTDIIEHPVVDVAILVVYLESTWDGANPCERHEYVN